MLEVHILRSMSLGLNEFWHEHSKGAATVLWRIKRNNLALLGRSRGEDMVVAARYFREMDTIFHFRPSSSRSSGDHSPPPPHTPCTPQISLFLIYQERLYFLKEKVPR